MNRSPFKHPRVRRRRHLVAVSFASAVAIGVAAPLAVIGHAAHAQTPSPSASRATAMTPPATPLQAKGTFEVKLVPQPLGHADADKSLGRMTIDKTFSGGLQGTGQGEMLMAGTAVKGSASYVAIERVEGTLAGRTGGFVLQHTGTMDRGAPSLKVGIVPDSGTGQLVGISGTLAIDIVDGKHLYTLDYTLGDAPAAAQ